MRDWTEMRRRVSERRRRSVCILIRHVVDKAVCDEYVNVECVWHFYYFLFVEISNGTTGQANSYKMLVTARPRPGSVFPY